MKVHCSSLCKWVEMHFMHACNFYCFAAEFLTRFRVKGLSFGCFPDFLISQSPEVRVMLMETLASMSFDELYIVYQSQL